MGHCVKFSNYRYIYIFWNFYILIAQIKSLPEGKKCKWMSILMKSEKCYILCYIAWTVFPIAPHNTAPPHLY